MLEINSFDKLKRIDELKKFDKLKEFDELNYLDKLPTQLQSMYYFMDCQGYCGEQEE